MADEVSSIGVRLTLNAEDFMAGMTAATAKTDALIASTKEAATVAGGSGAPGKGPRSSRARNTTATTPETDVNVVLTPAQVRKVRQQIIAGLGDIPITVTPQIRKAAQSAAQEIVAAQVTPVVGTRSGAAHAVRSNVKQNLPQRQYGGPVQQGSSYVVGERRAEVFTPRQTGYIHADAERFYREQERLEREHQARMRRMQGGGRVRPSRSLEARAFRMFGETDEISEAGYISPSGRMLDFSGRHEAGGYRRQGNRFVPESRRHPDDYLGGSRNVDHRQAWPLFKNLNGPEAMERMMQRGWVRVFSADPDAGQFMGSINKPLTPAQERRILSSMSEWGNSRLTGIMDVHKRGGRKVYPVGEADLDRPETPLRRVMAEANRLAARRRAGGGPTVADMLASGRAHASRISPNDPGFGAARDWYTIADAQIQGDLRDFNYGDTGLGYDAYAAASAGQRWPRNRAVIRRILRTGQKVPRSAFTEDVPGYSPVQVTPSRGYGFLDEAADRLLTGRTGGLSGVKRAPFRAALEGVEPPWPPLDSRMAQVFGAGSSAPEAGGPNSLLGRMRSAFDELWEEYKGPWGLKNKSQFQSILWSYFGEGSDLGSDWTTTKTGIAIPRHPGLTVPYHRAAGGFVEDLFHVVGRGAGFLKESLATAAGWAQDPFMAYMAWQGQQQAKPSSRGRRDVVGKPRLGRDFVGKPMAVGIPPWIFNQLGPEGLAGAAWQDAMSREDRMAFFARFAGYIPEKYNETWGDPFTAIPWMQDEKFVKAMGEQIFYDRASRPKVHRMGGPVRADKGSATRTWLKGDWPITYETMRDMKFRKVSRSHPVTLPDGTKGTVSDSPRMVYDSIAKAYRKGSPEGDEAAFNATQLEIDKYHAALELGTTVERLPSAKEQELAEKRIAEGKDPYVGREKGPTSRERPHTYGSLYAGGTSLYSRDGEWLSAGEGHGGLRRRMYMGPAEYGLFRTKKTPYDSGWEIRRRPVDKGRMATGDWETVAHPISEKHGLGFTPTDLATLESIPSQNFEQAEKAGYTYRQHLAIEFAKAGLRDQMNTGKHFTPEDAQEWIADSLKQIEEEGAQYAAEVAAREATPDAEKMVAGPAKSLSETVKGNREAKKELAQKLTELEATPFEAGEASGERYKSIRSAFEEAKRLRDDASLERSRRLLDPWAEAELNSENARRRARGAVPLSMEDVSFDPDNVRFHAAEPETMARFRIREGLKKGGGPGATPGGNLEVDLRPWESILDEGGSWRWLGGNDPDKVLKYQRRRLETWSRRAADDPMAQAWIERQKAEARHLIEQNEALKTRIATGDLDWKGAAGLPSKEDILPALEQAEANLQHNLDIHAKQGGMQAHIKEYRREAEVMRALWAKAGGEPRPELGAVPKATRAKVEAARGPSAKERIAAAIANPERVVVNSHGVGFYIEDDGELYDLWKNRPSTKSPERKALDAVIASRKPPKGSPYNHVEIEAARVAGKALPEPVYYNTKGDRVDADGRPLKPATPVDVEAEEYARFNGASDEDIRAARAEEEAKSAFVEAVAGRDPDAILAAHEKVEATRRRPAYPGQPDWPASPREMINEAIRHFAGLGSPITPDTFDENKRDWRGAYHGEHGSVTFIDPKHKGKVVFTVDTPAGPMSEAFTKQQFTERFAEALAPEQAAAEAIAAGEPPRAALSAITDAQRPAQTRDERKAGLIKAGFSEEDAETHLRALGVPQHEHPIVIAHAAIADAGLSRRAARTEGAETAQDVVQEAAAAAAEVVAQTVQPEAPRPSTGREDAIKRLRELGLATVSRRARSPEPPPFEETLGIKIPWLKRAAGGPAGEGLYIVNEMGPEAFLTATDARKLAQRRPDIMARIPGAADGARTGMIQKPAWSLFAPVQDGIIVRREDAQAALGAVRAQRGARDADEDMPGSPGPILPAREPFTPTGPIEPVRRHVVGPARFTLLRMEQDALEAHVRALKEQTELREKISESLEAALRYKPRRTRQPEALAGPPVQELIDRAMDLRSKGMALVGDTPRDKWTPEMTAAFEASREATRVAKEAIAADEARKARAVRTGPVVLGPRPVPAPLITSPSSFVASGPLLPFAGHYEPTGPMVTPGRGPILGARPTISVGAGHEMSMDYSPLPPRPAPRRWRAAGAYDFYAKHPEAVGVYDKEERDLDVPTFMRTKYERPEEVKPDENDLSIPTFMRKPAAKAKADTGYVPVGKGLEARSDFKDLDALRDFVKVSKRKEVLGSILGGAAGVRMAESDEAELGTPVGGKDVEHYVRFGHRSAKSARIARGESSDIAERLEELRYRTAGSSIMSTARTGRGETAVIAQLFGGGGLEAKRRQAELASARMAWNTQARVVDQAEKEVQAREEGIKAAKAEGASKQTIAKIDTQLATARNDLANAEKNLVPLTERLDKAEKAVEPTLAGLAKSFGSIVFATSAYGAAFSAANMLIQQSAIPAMQRLGDVMMGMTPTATKFTTALADQNRQMGGNVAAAVATTGVSAGLSESVGAWIEQALKASIVAKSGAKAWAEASDAILSAQAMRGGAQGLYGGYGGVLGSPLFAEQMGGGKGAAEALLGTIRASRGDTGLGRYLGAAGAGAAAGGALGAWSATPFGVGAGAVGGAAVSAGTLIVSDILSGQPGGEPALRSETPPVESNPLRSWMDVLFGSGGGGGPAQSRALYEADLQGWNAQRKAEASILDSVNAAMGRAQQRGGRTSETEMVYGSQEARDLANTPEAKALPAEIQGLMKAGMAFTDAAGNITADFEIIDQALKDWTEGLTIPDVAEWAKTVERQVSAQFQLMDIQSVVNRNLAIPLSQAMQRISSPYLPAGAGLVPNAAAISEGQKYRSGMEAQYGLSGTNWVKGISAGEYEAFLGGKPTVSFGKGGAATFGGGLGLPAWAAQEAAGYMTRATELQAQQEIANKKAIDDAYQMILNQPGGRTMYGPPAPGQTIEPGNADQYKTLMGSAQTASKELAGLQARIAELSAVAAQASWANTTRLALRGIADAAGMLGQAGGSTLGKLQRHLWQISRASQALDLALQQRQITTQIALAGFQAPGETGEERYMRQKEQLALAAIQQRKLGYAQETYTGTGQEWQIQAKRNLEDAQAAWAAAQKAHTAEAEAAAAQATIAALSTQIATDLAKADDIYQTASGKFGIANSTLAEYAKTFGGTIKDANANIRDMGGTLGNAAGGVRSFLSALGFTFTPKKGGGYNVGVPTYAPGSHGYMGRYAAEGYLGSFAKGATFTVGEAGPETVAILRNPRTHSLVNGGMDGGSSSPSSVTVNINGPVVRDDKDISRLARAVADEVERSLSRKGQLLGLRSPAY